MERLAPTPGQVEPAHRARSPGILGQEARSWGLGVLGQDAPGNRARVFIINNESCLIENLVFRSELNYILFLPAVTKLKMFGKSGLDSGFRVREVIRSG